MKCTFWWLSGCGNEQFARKASRWSDHPVAVPASGSTGQWQYQPAGIPASDSTSQCQYQLVTGPGLGPGNVSQFGLGFLGLVRLGLIWLGWVGLGWVGLGWVRVRVRVRIG
jgi:hypothetical protein